MSALRTQEGEEGFAWVQEAIGYVSPQQEPVIREALAENASGVHTLIAKITSDTNVRSPIAVLMHNIRDGKHRSQTPRKQAQKRPATHLQRAHVYFVAKMTDLSHTPWDEDERVEFAIDYALDHCGASGTELLALDATLRSELSAPAWIPTPTAPAPPRYPAKETEHVRLMWESHRRWGRHTEEELITIRDAQISKLEPEERTRIMQEINRELADRRSTND